MRDRKIDPIFIPNFSSKLRQSAIKRHLPSVGFFKSLQRIVNSTFAIYGL